MKLLNLTAMMILGALLLGTSSACNQSVATAIHADHAAAVDTSKYILPDEPDGAVGVIAARESAQNDDEIVLVGRIGGRQNPWIEGRAAFMMIDASMTIVADGEESGEGELCMDDCCASLRADCTTLVKVVDQHGKPLAIDARKLLKAEENDMVVVQGKVQRDKKEGTFTIAASGVYVRR